MKRFLKKSLAMFLCLTMIFGIAFACGVAFPEVTAADAVGASVTVKKSTDANGAEVTTAADGIISYADLVEDYGTATGADGLTDGFVYIASEYYEADGNLTDYYIKPGDVLTARVYVKSNMYLGEATIMSFFDNSVWDVKKAIAGTPTYDANGYTSGSQADSNKNHPAWTSNAYKCMVTSINITNVGWIKNTCGFDTAYLAGTDLVQVQTQVDAGTSSAAYQLTSDEWLLTHTVTLKDSVEIGSIVEVTSPDVVWATYINPATKKHDTRKRAYTPCAHITATGITSVSKCATMASQLDSGALDYVIRGLDHTFKVGDPAAPEAAKTVTFMVDGEVYGEVLEYNEGDTIAIPEPPVKIGYSFAGWDSTPGVMGTESLVFNATWTANKYTVTFDNDGTVTSEELDFGSKISLPLVADKEGHTFLGWFDENGTQYTADSTVPVDGVNLTAKYSINTYNAIFDADIGAWADGDKVKTVPTEYGAQIVAPANPEKEGHKFLCWNAEVGTMGAADVTFIAIWQIQKYTVTWNFDNGEDALVENIIYGNPVNAPADPTKVGYTFAGWDAEKPVFMPAENLTYTAIWTLNEHNVVWDADGETLSETVKYGETIVAPADPEKEGYTFTGWEGYTEGMTMPDEELTFVATWEINSYDVIWDVDGEKTVETLEFGSVINLPADPEKEGYSFTGWEGYTDGITVPAEDITFIATWDVNSYTVTWVIDGAEEVETYEFGASVVIPAPPEKEGYSFVKWDTEIPSTMPAEDIVITAVFEVKQYNVTFNATDGIFSNDTNILVVPTDYNSEVKAPEIPAFEGHTFVAWTPELAEAMPAEDLTYYAIWAEGEGVVYTVETYTMDAEGNYGEPVVEYFATNDATATVAPEAEEGFSVSEDSILEAEVAEDGSTVLEVYLERNTYVATFDANGGDFNGESIVTVDVLYGAEIAVPEAPVMEDYYFDGWDAEIPEAMPAEDLTFTAKWTLSHTHTTEEVVIEATCTEEGKKYYVCTGCGETVGEIEIIEATGHVAGEWEVLVEATTDAEGIVVKKCTVCGEIVEESTISKLPATPVEITDADGSKLDVITEIGYGETVTLSANNIPEGATVEWYVEGEGVTVSVSEDGKTAYVTSVETGTAIVTVVVTDADGNESTSEITIKSDACLIQRILHFFRKLFASIINLF